MPPKKKIFETGEEILIEAVGSSVLKYYPRSHGGDPFPLEHLDMLGHIVFRKDTICEAPWETKKIHLKYCTLEDDSPGQKNTETITAEKSREWGSKYPSATGLIDKETEKIFQPTDIRPRLRLWLRMHGQQMIRERFLNKLSSRFPKILDNLSPQPDQEFLVASIRRKMMKESAFEEYDLLDMESFISNLLDDTRALPNHRKMAMMLKFVEPNLFGDLLGRDIGDAVSANLKLDEEIRGMQQNTGIRLNRISRE